MFPGNAVFYLEQLPGRRRQVKVAMKCCQNEFLDVSSRCQGNHWDLEGSLVPAGGGSINCFFCREKPWLDIYEPSFNGIYNDLMGFDSDSMGY